MSAELIPFDFSSGLNADTLRSFMVYCARTYQWPVQNHARQGDHHGRTERGAWIF